MNEFETLKERNELFAARQSKEGTLMPSLSDALPHVRAIVIGCADMRVDPAHVLGIEPGEAVVMRNIGGRITPGLLAQLGMLGRISEVEDKVPGGGAEFHVVVLQHTDCGMKRLSNDPALLMQYFEVSESALTSRSVLDPREAVVTDVAAIRAAPGLPSKWLVSGLVYDVQTGLVETVVPPRAIAS